MGGVMSEILSRLNSGAKPASAGAYINGVAPAIARPAGVITYQDWFCYAFTGAAPCASSVTESWIKLALVTYELSLVRGNTVVDQLRTGTLASGAAQQVTDGYSVFTGKGRCSGCHSGSNFSDELQHQSGPLNAAGSPVLAKTPTLRQLALTYPYFHDGSNGLSNLPTWCQYTDATNPAGAALCRVVEFYNQGACRTTDMIPIRTYGGPAAAPQTTQVTVPDVSCDSESVSLGLAPAEAQSLVEFLLAM
jgi:hypothetical protein